MKKIALFAMGGTISAKGKNRLDLKDYQSGIYTGQDFLIMIPELKELAKIEVIQIDNISSTQLEPSHWIILKKQIEYYVEEKDFDGVVITQGTSTLEETAYFLHLTLNTNKAVVLVGSQRPITSLSSDAPLNVLNAFRVASDPSSKQKGVLVVANDQISSARDVTKVNTYRVETFQSGELGFLGFVDTDQTVQYYRSPTRRHTTLSEFHQIPMNQLPNVEVVYSYAGATGNIL